METRRIIFSSIFIFISTLIHAQLVKIDSETGEFKYDEVVQTNGLSATQLNSRAAIWIQKYYGENQIKKDSTSALQTTADYAFSWKFISKNIPLHLFYDVNIEAKDGRYRYEFSNFRVGKVYYGEIDAMNLKTYMERFPERYLLALEEPIDSEITKVIISLKNYMETEQMNKKDDDW